MQLSIPRTLAQSYAKVPLNLVFTFPSQRLPRKHPVTISVIDVRYKNVCLPFGAIGVWHYLAAAMEARDQWWKAATWLEEELQSKDDSPKTVNAIKRAKEYFRVIQWGAVIRSQHKPFFTASIIELSLLLSKLDTNSKYSIPNRNLKLLFLHSHSRGISTRLPENEPILDLLPRELLQSTLACIRSQTASYFR